MKLYTIRTLEWELHQNRKGKPTKFQFRLDEDKFKKFINSVKINHTERGNVYLDFISGLRNHSCTVRQIFENNILIYDSKIAFLKFIDAVDNIEKSPATTQEQEDISENTAA